MIEAEPSSAVALFGDRIGLAREFARALGEHGEPLGLIGPLEPPRLWTRHILNCAVVAPLIRPGRVADIGSGAGLPGIVLAIACPETSFVLIEPMERRVAWLEQQAAALGLGNVEVLRGRAEDVDARGTFDQVTARAVSALRTLIPLTVPLLRPGGELILMKGSGAERELAAAEKAIRRFRLRDVEVLELGAGVVAETTRVVRATLPPPPPPVE